jgi:arylsulfatase A-like enzyme
MILQDDLGHFDTGFNNPGRLDVSTNVTALAKDGIVLHHHYVFYWCSPTRRSFLTGRLPIHHGEMLSADGQVDTYSRTPGYSGDFSSDGDDIDLRWNIISQKLKQKGYANFWYGKGHTGYKSMKHLPVNRGFDHHMGFLTGAQDFYSADRWEGDAPFPNTRGSCTPGVTGCACVPNSPGCANLTHTEKYASNICGERAVASLRAHDASTPYFLYLPWQAVHHPHEAPPDWPEHSDDIGSYRGTTMAGACETTFSLEKCLEEDRSDRVHAYVCLHICTRLTRDAVGNGPLCRRTDQAVQEQRDV